jgi:tetratricopeptide (TPR) repeat protein
MARAQDPCPPAAEERYQSALKTKLAAKANADGHRKAAELYRSVVEWPEGGNFKRRSEALYFVGEQLEAAGDLAQAVAAYRELVERFPKSDFVSVAKRAADRLDPQGVVGGLDFAARYDAAFTVYSNGMTLYDKRDFAAARPELEKSRALWEKLLQDHRAHPRAVDVAVNLSDALIRLERLDEAYAVAEDALRLGEREATKPGAPNTALGDVKNAQRQLSEASRAIWCKRLDLASKVALALMSVLILVRRPWKATTSRTIRLWVGLMVADALLSGAAVAANEYVKRRENIVDPLLTDDKAAVLVFFPAAVGIALALGARLSYKGRGGLALALLFGVAGALATSTCLVQYFGFFNAFLPSL